MLGAVWAWAPLRLSAVLSLSLGWTGMSSPGWGQPLMWGVMVDALLPRGETSQASPWKVTVADTPQPGTL